LRLNFEFDVEVYDRELAGQVHELCVQRRDCAKEVTIDDMDARNLPVRLRDGVARLLTPYL
jgi:cardiolipin synthase